MHQVTVAASSSPTSARTHGDSLGVLASDAVNAWRNVARVSSVRNQAASLMLAVGFVATSHRWSDDRRYRGHERQSFPTQEHLVTVKVTEPAELLRDLDGAIRENDQFRACAIVQRYGELGHPVRPVFDVLLRYAISEDGRLHAEKYYRTVSEEFATIRPRFRWRELVALARVTASAYGFTREDVRAGVPDIGRPATRKPADCSRFSFLGRKLVTPTSAASSTRCLSRSRIPKKSCCPTFPLAENIEQHDFFASLSGIPNKTNPRRRVYG